MNDSALHVAALVFGFMWQVYECVYAPSLSIVHGQTRFQAVESVFECSPVPCVERDSPGFG